MHSYLESFSLYLLSKKNYSKNTVQSYKLDLQKFFAFTVLEEISQNPVKINKTNIMAYIMYLEKNRKSDATIVRNIASIKAFYRYLIREGIARINPAEDIEPPKVVKGTPDILTIEEVERLLLTPDENTSKGIRDRAMLELMYATGIRVTELISLKIKDINLLYRFVNFSKNVSGDRVIPIGEKAAIAVEKYLSKARKQLIKEEDNSEELFVNYNGISMSRQGFWKIVKTTAKEAGIDKDISPSMLRHSFAVHMLKNGASLNSVKKMLGHSAIATTLIYADFSENNLDSVYKNTHPRSE